jgi:redox-sensitive bicupin YhaK (pirin superfamily)
MTRPAVIEAKPRDLGGFTVRRALPSLMRRAVGPFVFLDHMGPTSLAVGQGMDVRPHPHVGLATVTYLFEGEIIHRDSLGSTQAIRPGDINWMTAGRGIVHSERTGPEERARGPRLHGLQLWVGLPLEHEEDEPSFHHHPSRGFPARDVEGARVRVLAGSAYGTTSPVEISSALFYVDVELGAGGSLTVPVDPPERGIYVVQGEIECAGVRAAEGKLVVLEPGKDARARASSDARLVLLGGASLGERHLLWNFVSSSKERLERAKTDWIQGRFPKVPGDETEFIPFPPRRGPHP